MFYANIHFVMNLNMSEIGKSIEIFHKSTASYTYVISFSMSKTLSLMSKIRINIVRKRQNLSKEKKIVKI